MLRNYSWRQWHSLNDRMSLCTVHLDYLFVSWKSFLHFSTGDLRKLEWIFFEVLRIITWVNMAMLLQAHCMNITKFLHIYVEIDRIYLRYIVEFIYCIYIYNNHLILGMPTPELDCTIQPILFYNNLIHARIFLVKQLQFVARQ